MTIETSKEQTGTTAEKQADSRCIAVPELKRIRYFYGQMLGAADFQAEQDYFREKLKLHNRCLHGFGTVCGLEVEPVPMEPECDPPDPGQRADLEQQLARLIEMFGSVAADETRRKEIQARVDELRRQLDCLPGDPDRPKPRTLARILCGLAYDCDGDEIVVRRPHTVDLLAALSEDDRQRASHTVGSIYISICYCAQPVDPTRPVLPDACGAAPDCAFGKLRDSYSVRVTVDEPLHDTRCEPCCSDPCPDTCLLLARVDSFTPGKPLDADSIHNEVRRRIAPYVLTRISGVSWTHGASYPIQVAADLLGAYDEHQGIEIRFSRPILTSTIRPGVVDLWVVEGGRGRSGNVYSMQVDYLDLPSTRTTDRIRVRQTSRESLQAGDRVLIKVRTTFLLDECCYAVDGENIGGRVPILKEYSKFALDPGIHECISPPGGYGPWLSGNGSQAGDFESWIYIRDIK